MLNIDTICLNEEIFLWGYDRNVVARYIPMRDLSQCYLFFMRCKFSITRYKQVHITNAFSNEICLPVSFAYTDSFMSTLFILSCYVGFTFLYIEKFENWVACFSILFFYQPGFLIILHRFFI